MRLTKKQIDIIILKTKKELKGKQTSLCNILGTYTKSGANWSYIVGWTYDGDLVVTRFGEVL